MDAFLKHHMVFEKAPERYPEMPQDVVERLDHELATLSGRWDTPDTS